MDENENYYKRKKWKQNSWTSTSLKSSTVSADMALTNATSFWKHMSNVYNFLALIVDNFVFAPASQAYVGRILCVCGILYSGQRRNV